MTIDLTEYINKHLVDNKVLKFMIENDGTKDGYIHSALNNLTTNIEAKIRKSHNLFVECRWSWVDDCIRFGLYADTLNPKSYYSAYAVSKANDVDNEFLGDTLINIEQLKRDYKLNKLIE